MEYKIVQSFWGKPAYSSPDHSARAKGGWPVEKYHYYSWALSCLQLRKYYEEVELVTDSVGKSILIDKLKLPYTNVVVALDALNHYNPDLWAVGKIHAYQLQEKPFIHVDADVFIWEPLETNIQSRELIAQGVENNYQSYSLSMQEVNAAFGYIPDVLRDLGPNPQYVAVNAGILGGSNIAFFQKFTREVFDFIDKNAQNLNKVNVDQFNPIYEQLLFYALADRAGCNIGYLFPKADALPIPNSTLKYVSRGPGYVHTMGGYKMRKSAYKLVEHYLRTLYPAHYHHISNLVDSLEI